MEMTEKEKEEYRIEEAICDERDDCTEGERCSECGTIMRYEVISTDADGNRPEMGYMCPKCD